MNKLYSAALFVLSCAFSCASYAAPQVGWYWNPNESGRGFFIESQNGITFIGAYLYDTDGHATWLVAGGPNADPYNFTGELYYKTGGQTLFGNYVAPGNAVIVGNVTVHFTDDTHATLTWPGGTVAIERQIFGGTDAEFQPYSGWWWNPAESGSGYSIELQGTNLFIVGFMYDDTGRPVWYYSAGPMTSENTYSGPVLQFANGQTMTGPYRPPGTPTTVATVNVTFSRPDRATLKFTGTSSAVAQRVKIDQTERTEEITRQFKDSFVPFYYYYVGGVTVNITASIPFNGVFGASLTANLEGRNMDWQLNSEVDLGGGLKTATYILLGADFTLTKQAQSQVLDPDYGIVTCTANASGSKHIGYPFTARSNIKVSNSLAYTVNINIEGDLIPLTGTLVCKGPGGGVIPGYAPPPLPAPTLAASGTGTAVGTNAPYILQDKFPTTTSTFAFGGSATVSGDYDFLGTDDCQVATCPPGNSASSATR